MVSSRFRIDDRLPLTAATPDVVAFHAGTATVDGKVVTSGGRVLCIAAYAPTLRGALDVAYTGVSNISFESKVFRRDIAHRYVCPLYYIALY